ncbi:MAG TPA: S9 family peptidase [Acidimicrobiia bacterium]
MPPITAAMVARSRVVAEPRWSPGGTTPDAERRLAWVEAFAARADLVVAGERGRGVPLVVTADVGVASVGSYGGGVWCWSGADRLVYAAGDGRLLVVGANGGPPVVLHDGGRAYAPAASPDGRRIAFVVERADSCDVAVVDLDRSRWPVRLSSGADYCFDPAWSPDGMHVAWHEWDFPNMPWDGSRVVVHDLASGGTVTVAGAVDVATGQPRFSPDGRRIAYTSDASGWTNVWIANADGTDARPLLEEPVEHAEPTWGPGQRSFAWSPGGDAVVLCRNEGGFGRLVVVPVDGPSGSREVSKGWHHGLDWCADGIVCVRSGARTPPTITVLDPDGACPRRAVARGVVAGVDEPRPNEPEPVTWRNGDVEVQGLLWRPHAGAAADGRPGPMLVLVHGGPHGQSVAGWLPRAVYFLARGWSVLMPNARGSTGYGRAYAQALSGGWGETDLADVVAGIEHARVKRWCDPGRVAAMGGSAGGFTVLQLCTLHGELLRAGVSLYGVTDLFELASKTHRFESRYLDRIVGALPEHAGRYRDRSPITHAARASVPVLVLQGDADPAVPKPQADALVDAMRAHGAPVEYHVYEGEGHGWSRPETVQDELERVERFLTEWVLRR